MVAAETQRHVLDIPDGANIPIASSESAGMVPGHAIWYCSDFAFAAGCVIIEPSTAQVVLIWSEKHQYWLLPRGRKDVGESLQQAALREAHEESGYRAELLPLYMPTRAPRTANEQAVTEAIFVSIAPFVDVKAREAGRKNVGGAVVTSWFVAQIPANAVSIPDGRTSDELDFVTHLVPFERAVELLMGQDVSVEAHTELMVIQKAIELWKRTQAITSGELVLDSDHDIGSSRIDRKYWD